MVDSETSLGRCRIFDPPKQSKERSEKVARSYVGPRLYNRELSWLEFNARVLAQVTDESMPLLERLLFCSIYSSNLDEFYMVRVAGLKDQIAAGVEKASPDGMTPTEQIEAIRHHVRIQLDSLAQLFLDSLMPQLVENQIEIVSWSELTTEERGLASSAFDKRIFPVLTPLAVDTGHPFPYISNLSLNLAVLLEDPEGEDDWFARVKVPPTVPRFVTLRGGRYIPVENVIAQHLDALFPGVEVKGGWSFRVTRNSDMALNDEDADDLLEAVEHELRRRRFGQTVRLEITDQMPSEVVDLLVAELELDRADIVSSPALLDFTCLAEFYELSRPDLKYSPAIRVPPDRLQKTVSSADMFNLIAAEDVFLHHPYDSFNASVTSFIQNASEDPLVQAIKVTLYRTSGDSPIVNALIDAAERGKQVVALVELKARFDEQANIRWAKRLEEAGAHVVYGLVGLKTHSKVTMVIRQESEGLRRYCHLGTGNYNPKTARLYEDVGLLTADTQVGADLSQLFNFLTGYGVHADYERLVVAPATMRPRMIELIDAEISAGEDGRIIFKMNSLVDQRLIEKLYEASGAGVRIDLIVRGICCLRPGIVGLSDNISVRSLVGRYLEHSRIFYFANGAGSSSAGSCNELFLFGSADLMPRNLDRRIEALLVADNDVVKRRLKEILDVNLADTALAWELDSYGEYRRIGGSIDAHERFVELAIQRTEQVRSDIS